jgi:drug/metabolite transporter (DMT)-like permease
MTVTDYRDGIEFLGLTGLWGLGFTAAEFGMSTFPPLLLNALRYDVAAVVLVAVLWRRVDKWWPRTRGDLLAVTAGGVLWIGVGNGVWFVGQDLTSSVFSGLMASLIPVATAAFSWLLLPGDKLTVVSLVGLAVSFAGALLFVWPQSGLTLDTQIVGKLLLLVGVVGSALGSVLLRRSVSTIPTRTQVVWSVVIGAVILHVLSLTVGTPWDGAVTLASVSGLLYLSLFGTCMAYLLYFGLLKRHPAIEITLVTYLVPVVAAAAGWALFGEPVTPSLVTGFAVVLVGFVLMKRQAVREELERVGIGS